MIFVDNSDEKELKNFFSYYNNKKIFLITGKSSFFKSGAKNRILKIINEKNTYLYFKESSNPEVFELSKIIRKLKKFNPDIILAIGGGSVIDYAKLSNVLFDQKNIKQSILHNKYKINKKLTKLIAIPTTAGSGAEETSFSTLYINKIKFSIQSTLMKPDYVFIIPELILSCTKKIKASSGFDAISQAIESLLSRGSNKKSVKFATQSLEHTLKNYIKYLKKPSIKNSFYMALGANFAGKAINISKTNGPHALSYPFTSNFGVHHGHAVSLTLNEFLKFNYLNMNKSDCNFNLKHRYSLIFKLTKTNSIQELDTYLKNLKKAASLQQNFLKLGVNIENDFSKILSEINIQRLSNNPISLDKEVLKKILFKEI
tara:strand:+ start:3411 stop:4526 length:1116 start_codon:yes stop_codon:yes gene_type:complete